eukprot:CAMPEP_0201869724 /NCGR_PEP_ID=MMETSP0902-20130614/3138_1 /ASSEMBLY_ACC=CAM_ASM_000551 /TAXON_ID=420261 /ORGANISM="Thalassiosira antarctica, Strain CCMP982" /LENGTH=50 /DNA_ID=CAMNT_0048395271 /DNA_START=161 /DNA_END=313 /DNA_ORIENTATION=+
MTNTTAPLPASIMVDPTARSKNSSIMDGCNDEHEMSEDPFVKDNSGGDMP